MRYLLPFLLLFLFGCAASEKAEDVNPAPGWVKNRPVVEGHYIGIGSARKVGMKHEYVAEARKNALQDMASQIASRVSSTSVLNTIENSYGVSESYSERIEIESESYLEGFEPVDYYESRGQYWVYYRISKREYRRNEIERREKALESALSKYQSARGEAASGRPMEAIALSLEGLQKLKGFLGKDLMVQTKQDSIDVGRELLDLLREVVAGFSLSAMDEQVEVKRGSSPSHPIGFKVAYNGQPVSDVPVTLDYSGGYLKSSLKRTNEKGKVSVAPGRVTSGRDRESMEAAIDHESIAVGAVSDVFIRSILKNIPPAKAASHLDILSPVLALRVSSEGGLPDYDEKIRELCYHKAEAHQLTPAISDQNSADPDKTHLLQDQPHDYALHIHYRFKSGESAGSLTSAYLTSEVRLTGKKGNLIVRKDVRDIKGVGHTAKEAREKAFESFLPRLRRRYIDQLLDERF